MITTQQTKYRSGSRTIRKLGRTAFVRQRVAKRNVKDIIKPFAIYATVFTLLIASIALNYNPTTQPGEAAVASNVFTGQQETSSILPDDIAIDRKVATDVAADFAMQTNMPIAPNVSNLSISLSKEKEIMQTDERVASKPQIVQPTAQSREIIDYKAKTGDTVQAVAQQFGVSDQTIKWANNLTSDALEDGRDLIIPPVDGVKRVTRLQLLLKNIRVQ